MVNSHDLTLTRLLDAPRERVWQAWTDPVILQKWWGPRGVTNPTCEWEATPGGKINIVMLAGDELGEMKGQEWPMTGQMQEVTPQEKIVFTGGPTADGKQILETLTTVTFQEQDGKTNLNVHIEVTKTTPEAEGPLAGMEMGWNQQLEKLTEQVKE